MCSTKCFSTPSVKTIGKYQSKEFMFKNYCQIRKMYSFTGLFSQSSWAHSQSNYFFFLSFFCSGTIFFIFDKLGTYILITYMFTEIFKTVTLKTIILWQSKYFSQFSNVHKLASYLWICPYISFCGIYMYIYIYKHIYYR